MIGRLRGILLEKQPPYLLLDVAGVAYEIQASMQSFYQLPAPGEEIVLHTHFVVREDAQLLFGFADTEERELFRALIKVNGVGPKMALAILSSVAPEDFILAIQHQDAARLVKLPGIGKKTAERLLIEMRDYYRDSHANLPAAARIHAHSASINISPEREAIGALLALGYKPQEAERAVKNIASQDGQNLSSEEMIRKALQGMRA